MPGTKSKRILKADAVPTVFTYTKKQNQSLASIMRLKAKEEKDFCVDIFMYECVMYMNAWNMQTIQQYLHKWTLWHTGSYYLNIAN